LHFLSSLKTLRRWKQIANSLHAFGRPIDMAEAMSAIRAERPDARALMTELRTCGVVAVPGYWSAQHCNQARDDIDRVIIHQPEFVQRHCSDHRIYGMESASAISMRFHRDSLLQKCGEVLCGKQLMNFITLGARIDATPDNRGSGDGWHRDADGFQFKAIIYLSDADQDNGPFQYLPGTHTMWRAARDALLTGNGTTRFSEKEIERLLSDGLPLRTFTAKAGTLLLVNTSGIHRGQPLVSGNRYALTNYYYPPSQVDEARITQFSPLVPNSAERVRATLETLRVAV